ncbi:MAG: hypothetical protein ABSB60_12040 [Terracidiphilus sp.]|jgi:hypothetical protein
MLVLDLRILFVIPFALAEFFFLWALWNFAAESITRKNDAPSRFVSASQSPTAFAQVFAFPASGSAASAAHSSGEDAGPRQDRVGSLAPRQLADLPTH